jgi:drug/metabolite transporter (DMT)-like permease
MKYTVTELDPYLIGLVRTFVAGTVMLALAYRADRTIAVPLRSVPRLALMGGVGMGVSTICWQMGLSMAPATKASLISTSSPVFALAMAVAIGQERLVPRRLLGMLVALAGVLLVIRAGGASALLEVSLGDLLLLGSAIAWSVYNVAGVPLLRTMTLLRVTGWATIAAGCIIAIGAPWGVRDWTVTDATALGYLGFIYTVGLGSIVAQNLWSRTVRAIGASGSMVYSYMSPILGVSFAALLLGESLGLTQALGAVLVLAGVTISNLQRIRQQSRVPRSG